uniref:Tetraspanin n=1 Tax=Labrus bergylta TaxID=56723 RepID=A0A3Q3FM21_9LABR
MGLEGGMKCVKLLLFFFNFIFWLCGLGLIVVGIMVQVAMHKTLTIKDASASGAPIVVIGIGVVIFFIAFFGCCGAWKENYCMVTTFAILLSLIIIVEIAAAIAGYVFREKVSVCVTVFPFGLFLFQLSCCGVNGTSDWRNFYPDGKSVPDSCCVNVTLNCGVGALSTPAKLHKEGCHDSMEAFLKKNIQWVIIAALVIAFLQIMGIVFACLLMRGIRSGYEVM